MDIFIRIFQGLLCLGFVIFIHELGHLIAARIVGVRVQRFTVFLAPYFSIIRWKPGKYIRFFVGKKQAELLERYNSESDLEDFDSIKPKNWRDTEYVLGWIPLGGYCLFDTQYHWEDNENEKDIYPEWDIRNFRRWKRLFITLAGIIANLLLAVLIFFSLDFFAQKLNIEEQEANSVYVHYSPYAKKIGFQDEDNIIKADTIKIRDALVDLDEILKAETITLERGNDTIVLTLPPYFEDSIYTETKNKLFNYLFIYYSQLPLVKDIRENSIADSLGVKRGDVVIALDSLEVLSTSFLFERSLDKIDSIVKFTLARKNLDDKWDYFEHTITLPSKYPIAGMEFAYKKRDYINIIQEIEDSIRKNHNAVKQAVISTSSIASDVATSYISKEEEEKKDDKNSGLIGLVRVFPNEWNWAFWWYAAAIISIGMAIFNLLPIPGLDGGQAIFCLLEIILRRKLSDNVLGWINGISWILLIIWIVWVNIKGLFSYFFG